MKQLTTTAVVLRRINYQETDRIVRVLTPDYGKLSLMAKGVRKPKSKLAGGIEPFAVNEITFIQGRSDIQTLVSSRGSKHFRYILTDLDRTSVGYRFIKKIDDVSEDRAGGEYHAVLVSALDALDDTNLSQQLVELWFLMQVFDKGGHGIELGIDANGSKLVAGGCYDFDFEKMAFSTKREGKFGEQHIKLLRLCRIVDKPKKLAQVEGIDDYLIEAHRLCCMVEEYRM